MPASPISAAPAPPIGTPRDQQDEFGFSYHSNFFEFAGWLEAQSHTGATDTVIVRPVCDAIPGIHKESPVSLQPEFNAAADISEPLQFRIELPSATTEHIGSKPRVCNGETSDDIRRR